MPRAEQSHPFLTIPPRLRVGISACLLGEEVRWNGGHKRDDFLVNTLGRFVEWVPLCPEVAIGLGTPRETLRLVGDPESPRLVAAKSGQDYTRAMQEWSEAQVRQLARLGLHGFVLKKDSPSCGMARARVYRTNGHPTRDGQGLFARALMRRLPLLPVEEEGRLHDLRLRENFIERLFAYARWQAFLGKNPSRGDLVRFHTAHKLTLLAHSRVHLEQLGALVADPAQLPWPDLVDAYGRTFMEALAILITPGRHADVMLHVLGFLKEHLGPEDKAELLEAIQDMRRGLLPRIVPLTLLRHYLARVEAPAWVHQQIYLHPYPKELMMHNHV